MKNCREEMHLLPASGHRLAMREARDLDRQSGYPITALRVE
jgi:hypothetical protein